MAAALAASGRIVAAAEFDIRTLDGHTISAGVTNWSDSVLQVSIKGGVRQIPVEQIVQLAATERHAAPLAASASVVLLDNGDRLVVDRNSLRVDDVRLSARWDRFPAWPVLDVPLETVRGVLLRPPGIAAARDQLLSAILDFDQRTDLLLLDSGDELASRFAGIDADAVRLAGAVEAIARSNVRGVAFNRALVSFPALDGRRALVSLVDGSRLTGRVARLDADGILHFKTAYGSDLELMIDRVAAVRLLDGGTVWLSQLEPGAYDFQPYLARPWPLRKDRCVTGGPLRLDGAEYPLGLGMHSGAKATWLLDGRYRWFHTTIGLDDTAHAPGAAKFTVEVDGKPVFESPALTADDAAIVLNPIDLRNAKQLTLKVDYGPFGDVQDYANWCDALLVRSHN